MNHCEQEDKQGLRLGGVASSKTHSERSSKKFLRVLAHKSLQNVVAIAALVVALISLHTSIKDREIIHDRERFAVTMFSEVLRNSAAQIVWSDRQLSPFRPPYLVIPVRLFVMNRSSFPQNISDIWVSFDEGSFEKMRFVTLSRITETNGSQVIWPKTVPPWGSIGLDLTVSIPIDEEVAKLIGADPGRRKTVNLGSVEKLFFTISSHKLKEVEWKKIKTRTTFDLRLLSPSPGGPTNLPYSVELP